MKTTSQTLDFVTNLLINDLNMLTVELKHDISVMTLGGSIESSKNVIEINFKDINDSDWFDTLKLALNDFLKTQSFKIIYGDGDTLLIFLH
jgi:hypothetical protein